MLRESDMTIATIAQAVGYDSQSKFTAAFKAFFQVLQRNIRKILGSSCSAAHGAFAAKSGFCAFKL